MLSMLLVPPLATGITWSAVSFFFFPQHRHLYPYFLHRFFHSMAVNDPPALVFAVLYLAAVALLASGFFLWHSTARELASSLFAFLHFSAATFTFSGLL